MIEKSHRWQKTAVAAAAAVLALQAFPVSALSLGRLTVQSALGEPLRAQVDILDINAEEAASIKATVASASAFAAAGLEYSAAIASLQATLMRRPDGHAYLQLTTDRTINEPFVDMILETGWSSGRIVRDYTMLFDPPVSRQASTATAPSLPQTAGNTPPAAAPMAPAPAPMPMPAMAEPKTARNTAPAAPAKAMPMAVEKLQGTGQQITVQAGDTAGKIAIRTKVNDVSLDQMLIALMRTNPDAFVKSNINRLRAGAVLDLPSAEEAKSISSDEATQMVVAQSKDFNSFRRNLADNAPRMNEDVPNRKAGGNVEATVKDRKSASATPDKLTLSKGALQAKTDEAAIARERATRDAKDRAAELTKNIEALQKLKSATATNAVSASSEAAAETPAPVVATAPPPPPAPKQALVTPSPMPEPDLLDQLMQDPVIPLAGGGGLVVLLGGFVLFRRRRQQRNASHVDSSFLESRLPSDSYFGASGGQQIDTGSEPPAANPSAPAYAASQTDPVDDVDPVAEADVYLAYGRDLQAEEILKEALRQNPGRLAIHTKMLEIFAKRRDTAGFQNTANQALALTGKESPEWQRICELGRGLDPQNPLYQPDGAQANEASGHMGAKNDVDLDLDIDLPDNQPRTSIIKPVTSQPAPLAAALSMPAKLEAASDFNPMDFEISMPAGLSARTPLPPSQPASLDMESAVTPSQMDFEETNADDKAHPSSAVHDLMEFDLGDLSLDLDSPASKGGEKGGANRSSAHDTKLALAEEFVSIGDVDGARALIEEVMADATGTMREKAEQALAHLN